MLSFLDFDPQASSFNNNIIFESSCVAVCEPSLALCLIFLVFTCWFSSWAGPERPKYLQDEVLGFQSPVISGISNPKALGEEVFGLVDAGYVHRVLPCGSGSPLMGSIPPPDPLIEETRRTTSTVDSANTRVVILKYGASGFRQELYLGPIAVG